MAYNPTLIKFPEYSRIKIDVNFRRLERDSPSNRRGWWHQSWTNSNPCVADPAGTENFMTISYLTRRYLLEVKFTKERIE